MSDPLCSVADCEAPMFCAHGTCAQHHPPGPCAFAIGGKPATPRPPPRLSAEGRQAVFRALTFEFWADIDKLALRMRAFLIEQGCTPNDAVEISALAILSLGAGMLAGIGLGAPEQLALYGEILRQGLKEEQKREGKPS